MRLKIWLTLGLFLPAMLWAQVTLDLRLKNLNALTLRPGDLNFTGQGSVPDVFELELRNTTSQPVCMRLKLEVVQQVQGQSRLIVNAITNQFNLPADGQVYRVTNQQLVSGWNVGGTVVEFEQKEFTQDFEQINQQFIETGKLPFGNYLFQVFALLCDGGIIPDENPSNNFIQVINPSFVELLSPGASVNQSVIPEIATRYPVFQWQTDPIPASLRGIIRFNLRVYQKQSWHQTVEDVINDVPLLRVEQLSATSFQYPADTQPIQFPDGGGTVGPIRLLEPGGVYYWLVEMLIPTATGQPDVIRSDVFRFRIMSEGAASVAHEQVLNILRQLLGQDFSTWVARLEEDGFQPTGTIIVNGRPVTIDRLNELLMLVQSGKLKISRVEIQ